MTCWYIGAYLMNCMQFISSSRTEVCLEVQTGNWSSCSNNGSTSPHCLVVNQQTDKLSLKAKKVMLWCRSLQLLIYILVQNSLHEINCAVLYRQGGGCTVPWDQSHYCMRFPYSSNSSHRYSESSKYRASSVSFSLSISSSQLWYVSH